MKSYIHNRKLLFTLSAFLSGFGFIVYQVIWTRYLQTILGVSVYAVAIVLALYMLGLAAGSSYFGRKLDNAKSARRMYLTLEGVIGLYGLFSTWLFQAVSKLSIYLMKQGIVPQEYSTLSKILLASMVLFVPTFLMGGALPALIKLYCEDKNKIGNQAGQIYSVHTLGSVFGAFITGFFMIRILGLYQSLVVASLLNVIAGMIVYRISIKIKHGMNVRPRGKRVRKRGIHKAPRPLGRRTLIMILVIFSISGMTAMAYEVYWTRVLSYFFRDTSYDFAIMLATFLSGLALGGAIGSRLISVIRNKIRMFGLLEVGIGVAALASLLVIDRLPYWAGYLQTMSGVYEVFGDFYWIAGNFVKLGFSMLIMLIPASMFGMLFPILSDICAKELKAIGKDIGIMNSVNSFGSALGSIISGFLLINLLGIQLSIVLTAFINILIGIILLMFVSSHSWIRKTINSAVTVVIITFLVLWVLPDWDYIRMSSSFLEPDQELKEAVDVLYYEEDAVGMTSVMEVVPLQQKFLSTNRLYTQNSSNIGGLEDHRRLAHIPLLLHPDPEQTLVVGLGSGLTLRGVGEHPVDQIDVVEISRGVVEGARWFEDDNDQILDDHRVHIEVNDGRNFAMITDQSYDVIIGDIYFPMSSGASGMYSVEYFHLMKDLLESEGIFAQWLPAHQLSIRDIKVIAQSFQSVFPESGLWYGMLGDSIPVIGLVGSEKQLDLDVNKLAHKLDNFAHKDVLKTLKLNSRSEEHTSELQSRGHLVCRLLLEKKNTERDYCANKV